MTEEIKIDDHVIANGLTTRTGRVLRFERKYRTDWAVVQWAGRPFTDREYPHTLVKICYARPPVDARHIDGCTKPPGHEGDHGHVFAGWPREDEQPRVVTHYAELADPCRIVPTGRDLRISYAREHVDCPACLAALS